MDKLSTLQVEELKFLGVHIIVVFIGGRETSSLDSINFASVPENDFFKINEFNQLSSIYQNVSEQVSQIAFKQIKCIQCVECF